MNFDIERWRDTDWREIDLRGSYIMGAIALVLLIIVAFTSIYTVQAESQGVVLRFGKYVKTVDPGLRYKFPFGIDQVFIVPVKRQLKQEFGFDTPGGANPTQFSSKQEQELERSTYFCPVCQKM